MTSAARNGFAVNGSLAAVLATGFFYLLAVPQPGADAKIGALRPSAVPEGTVAAVEDSVVKIVGTTADTDRSCADQTWPYIERRCLTVADNAARPPESAPAPLGIRNVLTGVRALRDDTAPKIAKAEPSAEQPIGSITAIAPTPPVKDMQAHAPDIAPTDRAIEKAAAATDGVASRDEIDIPLPQPRPEVALVSMSDDADAESRNAAAPLPLSRVDQRRMQREDRRRARAERRAAADSDRIVRRWTEYSYRGGDGDLRRMVVIHRGSKFDRFFRNVR